MKFSVQQGVPTVMVRGRWNEVWDALAKVPLGSSLRVDGLGQDEAKRLRLSAALAGRRRDENWHGALDNGTVVLWRSAPPAPPTIKAAKKPSTKETK